MKKVIVLVSIVLSQFAFSQVAPTAGDIQEVKDLVASTSVSARYNYCLAGQLTCRQLLIYKDKVTNQVVPSFADIFTSAERAVGSTGYFIQNASGSFKAILDEVFDGQVLPTKKYNENQNLTVTLDTNGLPTIHNVTLVRLGTTRYILADMSYSLTEAKIVGIEYDSADVTYQNPVNVVYTRVQ